MTRLTLWVFLSFVVARAQVGPVLHPHGLDDDVFQSCDDVLSNAVQLSNDIREPAYTMELFPQSQGRVGPPFPSEVTAKYAARWLVSYDPKVRPYALFYYAKGAYTLRCRGNDGHYVKLSGPVGGHSPLDLKLAVGKVEILHFYFTPINNARVFAVTDAPLDALDGSGLMAQVKELLSARHMNLYVRNDPWFLGFAPDPLLYLFTDFFKRISYAEYQATRTMSCDTLYGCKVGPSWY
jgi:hypothetical protein